MPISFTPTPTPSVSPTLSLTPSVTPTLTPTLTQCPYVCCFPSGFTNTTNSLVFETFLLDDGSFLLRTNNLFWQNTRLNPLSRLSPCGQLLNNYILTSGTAGSPGGIAKQSNGKIVFATGNSLYRLNADYTLDTTFTSGRTNTNTNIFGVSVNSLDEILISGSFTAYTTSSGTSTFNQGIYKLNQNGVVDTTWSGKSVSYAGLAAIEPFDGNMRKDFNNKTMFYGMSSIYGNSNYQGIVRLNDDFSLDTTFRAAGFTGTTGGNVLTAEPLLDGKYLVGGAFINYSGLTNQDFMIRLNSDGTLDTTFDFENTLTNQYVNDIKVQSSGRIIVADQQNQVRGYLPNGSIDSSFFSATTTGGVYNDTNLLLFPNDYIMIGGGFITYNGFAYPRLVKLDVDGNLEMCPFPSATPTNTPTQTQTPSQTSTQVLTPTQTSTPSPTPTLPVYIYAGTVSQYATDTAACTNKTCGRPYYKSVPTWSLGTTVYDDSGLTTPYNGNSLWIAVDTSTGTYCSGLGWAAIQINSGGIIIGFVSCP